MVSLGLVTDGVVRLFVDGGIGWVFLKAIGTRPVGRGPGLVGS